MPDRSGAWGDVDAGAFDRRAAAQSVAEGPKPAPRPGGVRRVPSFDREWLSTLLAAPGRVSWVKRNRVIPESIALITVLLVVLLNGAITPSASAQNPPSTAGCVSAAGSGISACPPASPTIAAADSVALGLGVTSTGSVYEEGTGPLPGVDNLRLAAPIVGIAGIANGAEDTAYYLVGADGGVFAFGAAPFLGSMGGHPLNAPVVGMVTGDLGYYLVAADGGVFSFGDAPFYGSAGNLHLNAPIVGMALTPDGKGYWLVAADGGVFSYGDAQFYGSQSGKAQVPVVGMVSTPDGKGYWLAGADGSIFTFGDAAFEGSFVGLSKSRVISISYLPVLYEPPPPYVPVPTYCVVMTSAQVYCT
jgi:hypothetical protein